MTLDELIRALETTDPNTVIVPGFGDPHSYRGDYHSLAFEPVGPRRVGDILIDARSALGVTYQGYKGGDFTMHGFTDVYIAYYGDSGYELSAPLLTYMLRDTVQ